MSTEAETKKILPLRRVDETRIVIEMRRRDASFMSFPIPDDQVRWNAESIVRLSHSIVREHEGFGARIEEVTTMICPACEQTWETDTDTNLPACCEVAESSWKS